MKKRSSLPKKAGKIRKTKWPLTEELVGRRSFATLSESDILHMQTNIARTAVFIP